MIKPLPYVIIAFLLLPFLSFSQKEKNIYIDQIEKQIYCNTNSESIGDNLLQVDNRGVENVLKLDNNKKKAGWNVLKEEIESTTREIKVKNANTIFIDPRDGQRYKTVIIGNQTWMAENLNYKVNKSWCYDNNQDNCDKYGRLYAFKTAVKGCPLGWHLPGYEDWKNLELYLGMTQSEIDNKNWRGTNEGKKLKSTSGWEHDGNGSNSCGFNALPGGYRYSNGLFYKQGSGGYWWSSKDPSGIRAWYRHLSSRNDRVYRFYYFKSRARSVRCIKD